MRGRLSEMGRSAVRRSPFGRRKPSGIGLHSPTLRLSGARTVLFPTGVISVWPDNGPESNSSKRGAFDPKRQHGEPVSRRSGMSRCGVGVGSERRSLAARCRGVRLRPIVVSASSNPGFRWGLRIRREGLSRTKNAVGRLGWLLPDSFRRDDRRHEKRDGFGPIHGDGCHTSRRGEESVWGGRASSSGAKAATLSLPRPMNANDLRTTVDGPGILVSWGPVLGAASESVCAASDPIAAPWPDPSWHGGSARRDEGERIRRDVPAEAFPSATPTTCRRPSDAGAISASRGEDREDVPASAQATSAGSGSIRRSWRGRRGSGSRRRRRRPRGDPRWSS